MWLDVLASGTHVRFSLAFFRVARMPRCKRQFVLRHYVRTILRTPTFRLL